MQRMALLNYFKLKKSPLPDPEGPLSDHISTKCIEGANEEVTSILNDHQSIKRSPYFKATQEQKAVIGRYAAENGIVNSIRRFQKDFPADSLKESTIRGWKNAYLKELDSRKRSGRELDVKTLPQKKTGRPLILDEETDKEIQQYLLALREAGGAVNCAIVRASAMGIIRRKNSCLLACNGGPVVLTKDWSRYLLERMQFVKRKANTKAKVSVENFTQLKYNYLSDIAGIVDVEEIPPSLIINWDHTALKYVPVGSWTMAKEGSKKVPLAGVDDKRQITAVLGIALDGSFLPPQLIYQGKSPNCLPQVRFPDDWHITHTPNHWANEQTTIHYIQKIVLPYICRKKKEMNLLANQHSLCIFDNFKAQLTAEVLELLKSNQVETVFVPPNTTDQLQPLDLSVNKPAKDYLRKKFEEWYALQVYNQGTTVPIKFPLSTMKPLGAQWIKDLYLYMSEHPEIARNGFKAAGIADIVSLE